MSEYFDKHGKPLDMMEWAKLHSDRAYCQVALDEYDVYCVSTVWLGLDHNFHRLISGKGDPLIFESAVINRGEVRKSEHFPGVVFHGIEITERYSTLEEALEGHWKLCAQVRGAVYS